MRYLVIFLLIFSSVCWAKDVVLTSDFTLKKSNIAEDKLLTKSEQAEVEATLKEQGRKLIHKELKPIKNDYQNDYDRGTVEYTPKCRNYSYHKVIIPDGTIIRDTNFSQKEPHTKAIEGKNLTFIDCNLVNNDIDPTWIIQTSNICRIKQIKKSEENLGGGKVKVIISHQLEQTDKTYKEVSIDEEIVSIGDDYNLLMLRLNK